MIAEHATNIKFTFSGHDKFHCRHLWLKKGYDYLQLQKSFSDEDAVIDLGVGKNMVGSIRFWLKAFGITNNHDKATLIGDLLLRDGGFDEYIEDDASLWLLHYLLVKSNFASTYSLIFNEFRKEKEEFHLQSYLAYIKRKSETNSSLNFNPNTIQSDFEVFKKMYISSKEDYKHIDDSSTGILTDLNLIGTVIKEDNAPHEDRTTKRVKESYYIEDTEREGLPVEIFIYSILDNTSYTSSISLTSLENDFNSPGRIFALSRSGIVTKIFEAKDKYPSHITYLDQAGIKELQFKKHLDPVEILRSYYETK